MNSISNAPAIAGAEDDGALVHFIVYRLERQPPP